MVTGPICDGRAGGGTDVGIYDLAATGNGRWIAYGRNSGFVTEFGAPVYGDRGLGVVDVTTGALHTVRVKVEEAKILASADGFYVVGQEGSVSSVPAAGSAARAVRRSGKGASGRGVDGLRAVSPNNREAAICDTVGSRTGRGASARVRISLLDRNDGVLRSVVGTGVRPDPEQSCSVSDDGSTAGTVARRSGRRVVVALRRGKTVIRSVNRDVDQLVGLSPSGRFALVQHRDDSNFGARGMRIQLLDLDSGRARTLRVGTGSFLDGYVSAGATTAHAAWTTREDRVVVDPVRQTRSGSLRGGLAVINTSTGGVRHLPRPGVPKGGRLDADGDARPRPIAINDDETAVIAEVQADSRMTDSYPYRISLSGGTAQFLLTESVRSYGGEGGRGVTRSADRSRAWLSAGWTCSSSDPNPLAFFGPGDPWVSPWSLSG